MSKWFRRAASGTFLGKDLAIILPIPGDPKNHLRLSTEESNIWDMLEYPVSLSELSTLIQIESDKSYDEIYADTEEFINKLESGDLVHTSSSAPTQEEILRYQYLKLLKRSLMNLIYPEHELCIEFLETTPPAQTDLKYQRILRDIGKLQKQSLTRLLAIKRVGSLRDKQPLRFSHTMIGSVRLDNIEYCAEQVFADGIEGDFLEAGVCQGGAAIFSRALQLAFGEGSRKTWVADSFEGLPPSSHDRDVELKIDWTEASQPWLAIDEATVRDNFKRYGLLDENVRFLPGFFADTLPQADVGKLAILRLDADMYQSTLDILENLYTNVEPGGFIIVDDYILPTCRKAIDSFRAENNIHEPLQTIDWSSVYWRKAR